MKNWKVGMAALCLILSLGFVSCSDKMTDEQAQETASALVSDTLGFKSGILSKAGDSGSLFSSTAGRALEEGRSLSEEEARLLGIFKFQMSSSNGGSATMTFDIGLDDALKVAEEASQGRLYLKFKVEYDNFQVKFQNEAGEEKTAAFSGTRDLAISFTLADLEVAGKFEIKNQSGFRVDIDDYSDIVNFALAFESKLSFNSGAALTFTVNGNVNDTEINKKLGIKVLSIYEE